MWDSAIIGTGHKGHSAIKVFAIPGDHSISQNDVSFWIHDVYLGMGMTLFKDTPAGRDLAQAIRDGAHYDMLRPALVDLLLKHVPTNKLVTAIDRAVRKAHYEGRKAKVREFQDLLEI